MRLNLYLGLSSMRLGGAEQLFSTEVPILQWNFHIMESRRSDHTSTVYLG